MYTLGELAGILQLECTGEPGRRIAGLASLSGAGPEHLSFLANNRFLSQLQQTRAGAVILRPEQRDRCPTDCLLSDNPYLSYARASRLFSRAPSVAAGVHPAAIVHPSARLGDAVSIGPGAVIEAGVAIADGAVVGAACTVGADSRIGSRTRLYPQVSVYHGVSIGADCIVHSHAVIGADGFGFAPGPEGWEKIMQLGGVVIGDGVEIGAGTTIDRGALDDTVIGDGVILDNQVQVAHNCRIGKNTAIAGCTGLAGSTIIGENCTLAGAVGVVGHLEICDNVHVTAMSLVTGSITEPGSWSSGIPIAPSREWKRNAVRFSQLESIHRRLVLLERHSGN